MRYVVHNGQVYAVTSGNRKGPLTSALTTSGRDLERFEQARLKAAATKPKP